MKKLLAKILVVVMISLSVLNTGVMTSFAEEIDDVELYDEEYDAEEKAFTEAMLTATEGAKAAAGDAEFENSIAAFPDSYKGYLRELHELYPKWKFVCDNTGLDWYTAVEKECGRDMQNSKLSLVDLREADINVNWKSLEGSDYDWSTGKWTTYDTGKWVGASKAIVAYQMDPRNYLKKDPSGTGGLHIYRAVFEFLDNSYYPDTQSEADITKTRNGLKNMVAGTFLAGDVIIGNEKQINKEAVLKDVAEIEEDSKALDTNDSEDVVYEATVSETEETQATESETEGTEPEVTEEENIEVETVELTKDAIEEMPENEDESKFAGSGEKSYVDIIMEAATEKKINPYVLAASILQEQGTEGDSAMISGKYYDTLYGTRYYGYYNYFNNEASGDGEVTVIRHGLECAIREGWDTPEKAIKGGAAKFSDNYVSKGQNTLYYKKFNVKSGAKNPTYTHQYMQNIRGAYHEAYKLGTAYKEMGILNSEFTFSIPVYKNMPSDPALYPKATCAPGCELKSLSVGNYSLSPSFSTDKYIYSVTVGSGTSSVKISATAKNTFGDATVEGTGTVSLNKGYNIKKVTVERSNGYWQSFYINIIRPESSGGGGGTGGGGGGSGSGGSGGGPGSGAMTGPNAAPGATTQVGGTFSKNWYQDAAGLWRIRNNKGAIVTNAWLCDDVVVGNGQNVWYLLQGDGSMLFAGLVQDNSGNYYSLETTHNGYYGMLRYVDGYYDCNGQRVYLQFSKNHNGSFGAVINAEGLAKLKQIYGVTRYYIGNENIVYTTKF